MKIHSLYLATLITKAIDTTSISYQPLWLRFTKKLDSSNIYTHTLRELPVHIDRETVPSAMCSYFF